MSFEIIDTTEVQEELSNIYVQFQKILSLSMTGYKSRDPMVDRLVMNFHKVLEDFMLPHRYVAFHRSEAGVYLNESKLPDSFVLRHLFEIGRCSGVCFQPGLSLEELRDCFQEMEECLTGGSSSFPLGMQRNLLHHYYWIPSGKHLMP
jgi:hypothetical protein